mmetsp:Transcript_58804/g.182652  ORF Transcript_58804/g.182652 Transcript_58804/m.182652 type:complete len:279 (-) Transcript_58804:414-1250(-)
METALSLRQLRALQVPPRLLAPAGGAVDDLPDAAQLWQVGHRAGRREPALAPKPGLDVVPVLLADPEAAQQADEVLRGLVGVRVPPLYEVQDLRLRADGHAVIAQRVLYEVDGQGSPAGVARHRAELLAAREHVAGDGLHERLARVLLRALLHGVLQAVEGVRKVAVTQRGEAMAAEPLEQPLVERVDRVLLRVHADPEHLVRQGLLFFVRLRLDLEEGHHALVDEAQQLGQALAVAVYLVALRQHVGVAPAHGAGGTADAVSGAVTRGQGVLMSHQL